MFSTSKRMTVVQKWKPDITNVRLQVVPFFLRDRWARETRARVKTTPREKGETRRGVRKIRQSPSFWTLIYVALTTQNSGGSSVAICQHLSKTHQPLSTLDIITIYVRVWHPSKNANELGSAWRNIAGNRHIHRQIENHLKLFRSRRHFGEIKQPKHTFSYIEELYFSKEVKENALALES